MPLLKKIMRGGTGKTMFGPDKKKIRQAFEAYFAERSNADELDDRLAAIERFIEALFRAFFD